MLTICSILIFIKVVSLTPELEHIPTAHFAPEALELGYTWKQQ